MSSRNSKKVVEDIVTEGVSPAEIERLLDVAAYAVEQIAPTLARSATFLLSDFRSRRFHALSEFELTVARGLTASPNLWTADFRDKDRRLFVCLSISG